jgi:mRNA interferase HigB
MRIISIKALNQFWAKRRDADETLKVWYAEVARAQWRTPQDILDHYRSADILPGNRVVFTVKGNQCRLVVKIHYSTGTVYIRFVGTQAEYDKLDAETI